MARNIKMLQRQLFEATRLSLTMPKDGTLASNAGALKRQLIMAKENYQLLFDDLVNTTSAAGIVSNVNNIVPADTPLIQWKGHKFNHKKFIFPTMDACLQQFQDVLESRGINVETEWKRIIKPKMSTGMSTWIRELIQKYPAISWGQFKAKLKVKYRRSEEELKKKLL